MTTATATELTFQTGDNVKRFDVNRGWLFGKVISVHFTAHETSVGAPHWRATVKWIRYAPESLPQSCLEAYHGEPCDFKLGDQVRSIECNWQGRVTGFREVNGHEMLECHHVCVGEIELDDKRWFDPRDVRLVPTISKARQRLTGM